MIEILAAHVTGNKTDDLGNEQYHVFMTPDPSYAIDYGWSLARKNLPTGQPMNSSFENISFNDIPDTSGWKQQAQQVTVEDRTAVLVKLSVPLYAISEIRNAIYSPKIEHLNESDVDTTIKDIVEMNRQVNHDKLLEQIIYTLDDTEHLGGSLEFTSYLAVPLKWQIGYKEFLVEGSERITDDYIKVRKSLDQDVRSNDVLVNKPKSNQTISPDSST